MGYWNSSSWTSWDYFLVSFNRTRETIAVLVTVSKNLNVGMHLDVYEPVWFRFGMMIDTVEVQVIL